MDDADRSVADGEAVSAARDTYRHVEHLHGSGLPIRQDTLAIKDIIQFAFQPLHMVLISLK